MCEQRFGARAGGAGAGAGAAAGGEEMRRMVVEDGREGCGPCGDSFVCDVNAYVIKCDANGEHGHDCKGMIKQIRQQTRRASFFLCVCALGSFEGAVRLIIIQSS